MQTPALFYRWGTEAQRRTVTSILAPGKGSVPLNHILPGLPPDYLALGHQPFSLRPRPLGPHPSKSTVGRGRSSCVTGSCPWIWAPPPPSAPLDSISSTYQGSGSRMGGWAALPQPWFPMLVLLPTSYPFRPASPGPTLPACLSAVPPVGQFGSPCTLA